MYIYIYIYHRRNVGSFFFYFSINCLDKNNFQIPVKISFMNSWFEVTKSIFCEEKQRFQFYTAGCACVCVCMSVYVCAVGLSVKSVPQVILQMWRSCPFTALQKI